MCVFMRYSFSNYWSINVLQWCQQIACNSFSSGALCTFVYSVQCVTCKALLGHVIFDGLQLYDLTDLRNHGPLFMLIDVQFVGLVAVSFDLILKFEVFPLVPVFILRMRYLRLLDKAVQLEELLLDGLCYQLVRLGRYMRSMVHLVRLVVWHEPLEGLVEWLLRVFSYN